MKKLLLLLLCLCGLATASQAQSVIQDSVTGNVTLTNDRTWLLRGYVYVVDGATLNIQPGTVIFGEKSTKGSLIVERGGKINAQGTAEHPIVFTSHQNKGSRDRGDWGGIILCGKAPINQNNSSNGGLINGGDAQIEGGPRSHFGGTNPTDNSGILSFVRIEFPGIAFQPNSEINGLTLGGVGSGTQIDHIQVSYSGDDNYEWFGGNVNAKYMIGFRGIDDEWDTDFGWSGKLQFGVSLRDPNIADISASNGFESDNDNPPNFWNPRTSAHFSNMTVVGPMSDTSLYSSINPLFGSSAHLRRNTTQSIYNSILMGYPKGLLIDGAGTASAALGDTLQVRNVILAGALSGKEFLTASLGNVTFNTENWFKTQGYGNKYFAQPAEVKLANPFNLTAPNFTPAQNSPAVGAASFANLTDPFWTLTTYVGAFDPNGSRWDISWANYDPQNTDYNPIANASIANVTFGATSVGLERDTVLEILSNTGGSALRVTSWSFSDTTNFRVAGGTSPFYLLPGEKKVVTFRFLPTVKGMAQSTLTLTFADNTTKTITLSGSGVQPAGVITLIDPTTNKLDFALVRLGESSTKNITFKNTGSADLTVTNYSITGSDASAFTIVSGGTGSVIKPGEKHSVSIRFNATDKATKNAALNIANSTAPTPLVVNLVGTGIQVCGQDILEGDLTGNVRLTNDRTWLLRGYVYVVDGATLTIDSGTVIFGEKTSKGSLIVERGGKLLARGTKDHPIVFTSQVAAGSRDRGDWGGVILCGKAPINQNNTINGGLIAGGDAQIEGGPRSHFGGTDIHDNSGVLSFVRIEFPGIAFQPNSEINGLTFGGVGDATQIDHVQVSYSGDDNYEWFGGAVNAKYMIGLRGIDDEWDTDFGWSGKLQFGFSLRDPNIADISASNGFESDNDDPPNYWNPRTSAKFSNMTVVGPMSDPSQVANINPLFGSSAHLRRNTKESIYNSILMGYPKGLLIDGAGTALAALKDTLQVRNTILAGATPGKEFLTASLGSVVFNTETWFKTPSFGNNYYATPSEVKLTDAFNLSAPNPVPMAGSPAAAGANFSGLDPNFFTTTSFRGAFDPKGNRWDMGWSNYTPQTTDYSAKPVLSSKSVDFGKVSAGKSGEQTISVTNAGLSGTTVTNIALSGTNFTFANGNPSPLTLIQGETKTFKVIYSPKATGLDNGNIVVTYCGDASESIALKGEGTVAGINDAPNAELTLGQNIPNPFNGMTSIKYSLPNTGFVNLEVYDITGKTIARLVNGTVESGDHAAQFDGNGLARGTYFYRLTVNGKSIIRTMVLQ